MRIRREARRTIVAIVMYSVLALGAMGAAYVGSFHLLHHQALQKNATYGLFPIERGDWLNCSRITAFFPEDREVWPFTVRPFSDSYRPLIWRHMRQRPKTSESDGRPFDLSRTRWLCIEPGVDARVFEGDVIVSVVRNGPILAQADFFGFRIIADLAR